MPQTFLYVRSADRTLGTANSFRVTLPQTYRSITSISLVSAEVPYSLYNVSAPYLQGVTFVHNGSSFTYTLPAGFYTIDDLTANLVASLQSAFPSAGVTSVGYSKTTGRLYVVYTSGLAFSVQATSTGSLGRILGTDPSGVATLASGGVLALPGVATLAPVSTLFVQISELPSLTASTNGLSAFARIQLSSAPGGVVMANAAQSVYNTNIFPTPIASLSTLTVTLVTHDNVAVDLHGCEWAFTLVIASA